MERGRAWRANKAAAQQATMQQLRDSGVEALAHASNSQQSDAKMLLMLNEQVEEAQNEAQEKERLLVEAEDALDAMTNRWTESKSRLGWWVLFVRGIVSLIWERTSKNRMALARSLLEERENLKKSGQVMAASLEEMQMQ